MHSPFAAGVILPLRACTQADSPPKRDNHYRGNPIHPSTAEWFPLQWRQHILREEEAVIVSLMG